MDEIQVTVSAETIVSGGELYASASFFDGGTPVTPDSTDYKIDLAGESFLANGTIRNWTAAVPGESTSVLLEGVDTLLLNSMAPNQAMQVVFRATLGGDTIYAADFYEILSSGRSGTNVSYSRRRLVELNGRIYEIRNNLEMALFIQEQQMIKAAETTPAPAIQQTVKAEQETTVIPMTLKRPTIAMPSTNTGLRQLARRKLN